jgi:hypothetical protein
MVDEPAADAADEKKAPRRRRLRDDAAPDAVDPNDTTQYQGLSTATAVPDGPTVRVRFASSFHYNRANHTSVTYTADGTNCDGMPGEYEIPQDDADNWWVQAHLVDPPPPIIPPMVGSPAHIQQLASAAARTKAIYDALSQEEQTQLEATRDARLERSRAALGASIERTEP